MATRTPSVEIVRPDGKARLRILSRDDGFFEYRVETLETIGEHNWWEPAKRSGLFDTIEAARGDGIAVLNDT